MAANREHGPRLYGREAERKALAELVDGVRRGRGAAVVVGGEPGTGKTTLLDDAAGVEPDVQVLRAAGVESEKDLAYSGLHQLCGPVLNLRGRLPGRQRDALEIVFGMTTGPAPERLLAGSATLGLLAEAAAERPLMCMIDDAHWLDRASVQTLAFAARRLASEPVLMLFATREPAADLAGVPAMMLSELPEADARDLLASVVRWPLDQAAGEQIVAETRGNPRALLELLHSLSPAQLAGGFGLPDVLPGATPGSLPSQLRDLPPPTRLLLLVAAAEPTGDPALLWRAAGRLGIHPDAAVPAVEAALVTFGSRIRFRDFRVRSTVYHSGARSDRQAAHYALAQVSDPRTDPDRRAWHLSHAGPEPDEEVAAELQRTAVRAQARGGLAAAAAFLERAAMTTPAAARRSERTLAAAELMLAAGEPDAAAKLLEAAEESMPDDYWRARAHLVRAQVAYAAGRDGNTSRLLLDAARRLERFGTGQARTAYLDAIGAAVFAGRLAAPGGNVMDVARALRSAPPDTSPSEPGTLLAGLTSCVIDGYGAGVRILRRAVDGFGHDMTAAEELRWLPLACYGALLLWDDQAWHALSSRYVRLARASGALGHLPSALTSLACSHLLAGEPGAAKPLAEEARVIAEATGGRLFRYDALSLAALTARHDPALALIDSAYQDAAVHGEGLGLTVAKWATAVLCNGLGRYGEALSAAAEVGQYADSPTRAGWATAELIEAAVRTGQPGRATGAMRHLSATANAAGTGWALGVRARCLALLSDGEPAEELYRAAICHLRQSRARVDLARAHLLYGEWLRRENRRIDAREQLRRAHEMLTAAGAEGFAERARRELSATCETVRKRTVETDGGLTAQEKQIAVRARDGQTNTEISAELFLSPRTIEWHLHKIFVKLGITSRRQLRDTVGDAGTVIVPLLW